MAIKIIEFCGGIGAQHQACVKVFGQSNVQSLVYGEWDQKSVNPYNAIYGTNYSRGDMQFIRGHHLSITHNGKDIFIAFASTPCQSLSNEGKREGMAPGANFQSSLIWEGVRILRECRSLDPVHKSRMPHYFIIENVVGIHNKKNRAWFDTLLTSIADLGYDVKWFDLNGKDLGEAQMRNRCFVVCRLKGCGLPEYQPVKVPGKKDIAAQQSLLEMRMAKIKAIFSKTTMAEIKAENRIIADFSTDDYLTKAPYLKDVDLTQLAVVNRDFAKTAKKLKIYTDRVPTILTSCSSLYVIDPYNKVYRRLTTWEAWQLMNFSRAAYDAAKKDSCKTALFKTAGDSIMVNVLAKVLEQIPTTAPASDKYAGVPERHNGWLHSSRTSVYKKAYKTFNAISGLNIPTVLPERSNNSIAIFGLETKMRRQKAAAKGNDVTQEDLKLRRNIKKRILNLSALNQGAFFMPNPVVQVTSVKQVTPAVKVNKPAKNKKQKAVAKRVRKAQVQNTTLKAYLKGHNKHKTTKIVLF